MSDLAISQLPGGSTPAPGDLLVADVVSGATYITKNYSIAQLAAYFLSQNIPSGTTAARPNPASVSGQMYIAIDQSKLVTLYRSNGVTWDQLGRSFALSAITIFVNASTGNDNNDGLTAGTAVLTIQKAVDIAASIDHNNTNPTIRLADGTYAG